jgi:hypothetical protein
MFKTAAPVAAVFAFARMLLHGGRKHQPVIAWKIKMR